MPLSPALRTLEAVRPAHLNECSVTLILTAIEPNEFGHAQTLLKLHRVACHRALHHQPTTNRDIRTAWQNGGNIGVIRSSIDPAYPKGNTRINPIAKHADARNERQPEYLDIMAIPVGNSQHG